MFFFYNRETFLLGNDREKRIQTKYIERRTQNPTLFMCVIDIGMSQIFYVQEINVLAF